MERTSWGVMCEKDAKDVMAITVLNGSRLKAGWRLTCFAPLP